MRKGGLEVRALVADFKHQRAFGPQMARRTGLSVSLLSQIERAEAALFDLGFRELRVRHHGELARIELPAAELARALEQRHAIVAAVKRAGYLFVTLDLAGFRSGSLEVLLRKGAGS